ncbi:hypothetical protein CHS0354_028981 [Potamilus streckersoni]|uniref:Rieske domain-containing protein n=1 Tax=Potamilus streckersoni TaxID=2493646 RepID=A0AAE0T6Y9_9BIVA|nr:hypothetical protein CHS0354_028981 [Potamilus streckersoni]
MEDKIFLPVDKLRISDLHDWSKKENMCKTTTVKLSVPAARDIPDTKILQQENMRKGTVVKCNEEEIALFRHDQDVFAIREKCPHAGGPLHLGDIEELVDKSLCVRCPWHKWKFDLKSGQVLFPKGHKTEQAELFPVKTTEEGKILIGFEGLNQKFFNTMDDIHF